MMTAMTQVTMPHLGSHNGTFTVTSPTTGDHRTFKITTIKEGKLAGRRVLGVVERRNGKDHYNVFAFVDQFGVVTCWHRYRGQIYERYADLFTRFEYWMTRKVEFLMESQCRRCNRRLTNPESLLTGIGPECAKLV